MTIQPVTLVSAAFWQKISPINSQNRTLRRKLQSIRPPALRPPRSMGVRAKASHRAAPNSASRNRGAFAPARPAAAMTKGHSSAPQA